MAIPKFASCVCMAIVMVMLSHMVSADSDMLQDICVADVTSGPKVNGFACKANATADDFFFDGLAKPGNTTTPAGSAVTPGNVEKIPGLNTLGVSISRVDYAVEGINPPHTHPRATEIVFVLEGEIEVGFITTANVLFSKTIQMGEVFVFPQGLLHFQRNVGKKPAAAIAAFNSQLPGTQSIAATLFAAKPMVPDDVLTKTFRVGDEIIKEIESKFK